MKLIETLKHREAFEYYYSLGDDRSLKAVAAQMGITLRCAEQWSSKLKWADRITKRDAEIAEMVDERMKKRVTDQKIKYHNLLQGFLGQVVKGMQALRLPEQQRKQFLLDNPDAAIIKVDGILDVERLIKMDLLLIGEDTERIGGNTLQFKTLHDLIKAMGPADNEN